MIVIYNPTAGRRRAHHLRRVLDRLIHHGIRPELAETRHAGHAASLARDAAIAGERLIVAAGGDGTIAEVAGGLIGSAASLGVIPLGTANVLAHEMALPFAPVAVAAALATGRTRTLWPGVAHYHAGGTDRLFVQMLGVGLDARVVHNVSDPLKRWIGHGAYVVQTMRELVRSRHPPLCLRVDGVAMQTGSAIVSKGRLYAGRFLLAPDACASKPGFSLTLFDRDGALSVLAYGAVLPLNLLPWANGVRQVRARTVEFVGPETSPAQADGDAAASTPLTIRDAAGPIQVVTAERG